MIFGLLVPNFWNPIHDNVLVWCSLAEGLLLPLVLYLSDASFAAAVKKSFRRHSHTAHLQDLKKSKFLTHHGTD